MLAIDPGKPVACVPAPRWRSLPSPDSARSSGRHTAADRTEVDLAVGTGDAELVATEVGVPAKAPRRCLRHRVCGRRWRACQWLGQGGRKEVESIDAGRGSVVQRAAARQPGIEKPVAVADV